MQIYRFLRNAIVRAGISSPNRRLGLLAWKLFICAIIGCGTSRPCHGEEPKFVHTQGKDIVKESSGEKVRLRGVGLGNWMLPEGYMWKFGNEADRPRRIEKLVSDLIGPENAKRFWTEFRRNYIGEADIRRISELGYNSVRPALNSRLFLTESGEPDLNGEGFQLLDNLVKWCKANGIYVIIDMHAAPGGQTGQNIDDSADDQPELFMQAKYVNQTTNLWAAIARRYKDEPAVTGYDLLNEPLPARTGAEAKYKVLLEPLYKRITAAIRGVDPKHMIILEGADWANDWSAFTAPFDKNLVYEFHYYCWDNPVVLNGIAKYLNYQKRFNAPIWVGETGERDNTIYWATTEYFEANNIGWCFWPWKKMDADNCPCSVKRPKEWDAITAYSRGGTKPATETAQKAFDELLTNIRLENCVFHSSVVNAMMRRVPGRIEAENFGHDGTGISCSVTDSSRHSKYYRPNEPVTINIGQSQRPRSYQYVTLQESEWTAYSIDSSARQNCEIAVRARAVSSPAEAELVVSGKSVPVKVSETTWTEIKLGSAQFNQGLNQLKWVAKQGTVDLDWIDVRAEP